MNPSRVFVGTLKLSEDAKYLTVPVTLRAFFEIHVGVQAASASSRLPPLETGWLGDESRIFLPVEVAFGEIEETLKAELKGKSFTLGQRVSKSWLKFSVSDVMVRGYGDEVAIQLEITGSANGRLFLTGRPALVKGLDGLPEALIVRDV